MDTSRTRTRDGRHYEIAYVDTYPASGPNVLNSYNGTSRPLGMIESMSDNVNKGYLQRRRSGETIMSDMYLDRNEFTGGDLDLRVGHPDGSVLRIHGNYSGTFWNGTPRPPLASFDQGRMAEIALVKAYAKAKQPVVQGGEIFLDLGRTVDMLRRPFSGSLRLLQQIGRRRRQLMGNSVASARAAANAWLEYRYGWQPIILDGESIMGEVNREYDRLAKRILVARASESGSYENTIEFTDAQGSGFPLSGTATVKTKTVVSAGVRYQLDAESRLDQLARITGSRTADVASTIWERVPYSFVVDWFTNVGDYLQAIAPVPGLSILGSWTTGVNNTVTKVTGSCKYNRYGGAPGWWYSAPFSDMIETVCHVARDANPPMPSWPVLTNTPLSRLHFADAASLMVNSIVDTLRGFRH